MFFTCSPPSTLFLILLKHALFYLEFWAMDALCHKRIETTAPY
nr:MAG TPA: hypothetical protein [Caudoviricetes sp.]